MNAADGRWGIDNCDAGLYRYLCQKGTSTSLFWNDFGNGNQYAYIEHQTCIPAVGWTAARDMCRAMGSGSDLANIPAKAHEDFITNTFASGAFQSNFFWIGLNDVASEGTIVWENGGTTVYRNWDSGEPSNNNNKDCVAVKHSSFKWALKQCDGAFVKGALCKKNVSRKKREINVGENKSTDVEVVETYSRRTFVRSPTAKSGRRDYPVRVKRSINTETQREMACEPLFGGSSLYWKYDYEVPSYCWSK